MQEEYELINFGEYNGIEIHARALDKMINTTEMCRACGKNWWRYRATEGAKRFLAALSATLGVPESRLVVQNPGGNGERHTYADSRIALHCAAFHLLACPNRLSESALPAPGVHPWHPPATLSRLP